MLFLHFGSYLEKYWVNFGKTKCILSRKTREIQWKQYFSSFRDFSRGFECVFVQLLLIQTLYSVQFYIRMKAILSSIRWYDYFVCRVNRFRVMIDFLVHVQFSAKHFHSIQWFERGTCLKCFTWAVLNTHKSFSKVSSFYFGSVWEFWNLWMMYWQEVVYKPSTAQLLSHLSNSVFDYHR